MILIQIQQEIFLYRPVNTDKPNFVSFLYLLVQLLHLPLKFHLSKVSRNQKPFGIPCQNSEYAMQEYSELRKPIKTRIIKTYICKKFRRSWICLHVCVFRKIFEHFLLPLFKSKIRFVVSFLRSFVCLPQFISIQSRQTANYLSC